MIFSDELLAVLRQAIILAAAQEQDVADLPHMIAALTQPLPDEPVIHGGMTMFSPAVDRVVKRAKHHARAQGSAVTERRHLAAALRELGDTPITSGVAAVEGTFEDHVTAHDPELVVIHEDSETVHGSATVAKRPDHP
jgi:hypothetical protein